MTAAGRRSPPEATSTESSHQASDKALETITSMPTRNKPAHRARENTPSDPRNFASVVTTQASSSNALKPASLAFAHKSTSLDVVDLPSALSADTSDAIHSTELDMDADDTVTGSIVSADTLSDLDEDGRISSDPLFKLVTQAMEAQGNKVSLSPAFDNGVSFTLRFQG